MLIPLIWLTYKSDAMRLYFALENLRMSGNLNWCVCLHYAQNWVWKKLKPADMRPWSPNYVVFCGPETVILKILTLAKRFLQTD